MALLAEEVVEEWLNRQGYFTIRGIKAGVDEIDLVGIRPTPEGFLECRHLEVQASMRPISYISKVPKHIQKIFGKAANSAKRSEEELIKGVEEWVAAKFDKGKKRALMERLAPGPWTRELVIHRVRSIEEVRLIEGHGIRILFLPHIVHELAAGGLLIQSASGADLADLIHIATEASVGDPYDAAVYRRGR